MVGIIKLILYKGGPSLNNALDKQKIEEYLSSIGRPIAKNFLYVFIKPSNMNLEIFTNFPYPKLKYFIVAFYKEDILLFPLTLMGEFDTSQKAFIINRTNIDNINIKKGFLEDTIIIVTDKGNLKLSLRKKGLRKSWQVDNLKFLQANEWTI